MAAWIGPQPIPSEQEHFGALEKKGGGGGFSWPGRRVGTRMRCPRTGLAAWGRVDSALLEAFKQKLDDPLLGDLQERPDDLWVPFLPYGFFHSF